MEKNVRPPFFNSDFKFPAQHLPLQIIRQAHHGRWDVVNVRRTCIRRKTTTRHAGVRNILSALIPAWFNRTRQASVRRPPTTMDSKAFPVSCRVRQCSQVWRFIAKSAKLETSLATEFRWHRQRNLKYFVAKVLKLRDICNFRENWAIFSKKWPNLGKFYVFWLKKLAILWRKRAILWRIWRFRAILCRGDFGDRIFRNWRNLAKMTWEHWGACTKACAAAILSSVLISSSMASWLMKQW